MKIYRILSNKTGEVIYENECLNSISTFIERGLNNGSMLFNNLTGRVGGNYFNSCCKSWNQRYITGFGLIRKYDMLMLFNELLEDYFIESDDQSIFDKFKRRIG